MKAVQVMRLMLVLLSVPFLARQTRQLPAPHSTLASPSTAPTTPPMPRLAGQQQQQPVESGECSQRTTWITDPQLAARFPWVTGRNNDCQRGQQDNQMKRPPPPPQQPQWVERPPLASTSNISAWLDPNRGTFFATAVTGIDQQQQQQQQVAEEVRRSVSGAGVEELVSGQVQAAKWLDACNRRGAAEATRPITLYIGPQSHQPMRLIEQERKHSELFVREHRHRLNASTIAIVSQPAKAEQAHTNMETTDKITTTSETNARRKRSILDQRQLTVTSASNGGANKQQQTGKYFKAKKTSFRMANKSLKKVAKLGGRGGAPKRLYLYSPTDNNAILSTTTTSPPPPPTTTTTISPAQMEFNARARKAVERVFAADINVSWAITSILHGLNNSRQVADRLATLIRPQADQLRGSERADELERQRTSWLPPMESLVELPEGAAGNWTSLFASSGLYDGRARDLVLNMSHYIEFFLVSFEQMTFELNKTKDNNNNNQTSATNQSDLEWTALEPVYGQLESSSLAVLCETEQLMELLEAYIQSRLQLEPLIPSIKAEDLDELAAYYERTIASTSKRESKLAGTFKSPLRLAYDNSILQSNQSASGDGQQQQQQHQVDPHRLPEHVWRQVMPMEQRKLSQATAERAFRDESILRDYKKLLANYNQLLMHNYI